MQNNYKGTQNNHRQTITTKKRHKITTKRCKMGTDTKQLLRNKKHPQRKDATTEMQNNYKNRQKQLQRDAKQL